MRLHPNFKNLFLAKLAERGAMPACEICGHNNWATVDQAIGVPVTDLSGGIVIPTPQIPAGGLVCNNCGNLRLFALGALGLLIEDETPKEKEAGK